MTKFILSAALFCLAFSCKDNIDKEGCTEQISESQLPQWLTNKIEELGKDDYKAEIHKLQYSWGSAIFINPCTECADFYTYIYDNCGTQICRSGGFIGGNNCPAAYLQDSQKSLIWKE
ncbi:MAG TPA: hypothetical protein VIT44_17685 [Cyclobacteriaceae bacterium]